MLKNKCIHLLIIFRSTGYDEVTDGDENSCGKRVMDFLKNETSQYTTTACSPEDAVEKATSLSFDLMITDYRPEEITTWNLLEKINNIPFIVFGDKEAAYDAWKSGACDYIANDKKCSDLQKLPLMIERAVKQSSSAPGEDVDIRELSQKAEEEANQARNDFLSNVSHGLKTPLTSICGFITLLSDDLETSVFPNVTNLTPKIEKRMKNIRESIEIMNFESIRLTSTINDVVDNAYSKYINELIEDRTRQLTKTNDRLVEEIDVRKQTEKKKQQLFDKLENTYEELKQSQEQLVQSEKMASLGQLVAGIAHEINNPLGFLNSNMGNLKKFTSKILNLIEQYDQFEVNEDIKLKIKEQKEQIRYDYLKDRIEEIIDRSGIGVDRMKKIVMDLKTFSRLDAAELIDTDINNAIETTLGLLVHEYKNRIEIIKKYGNIPLVACYSSKLNQVFMNILVNACHAIEDKGEIRIKTSKEDNMVRIEIGDTGKGIPEDYLNKIFDPFFTTKPVGKGTGLGLSISYKIIQEHKGELIVDTKVGIGTTFKILIPVHQENAPS